MTATKKLWQFITDHLQWSIVILVVLLLLASFWWGVWRFGWDWTGFGGVPNKTITTRITDATGKEITTTVGTTFGRTLWDWMGLLIIPAVLAGGAILLNRAQRQRELEPHE